MIMTYITPLGATAFIRVGVDVRRFFPIVTFSKVILILPITP